MKFIRVIAIILIDSPCPSNHQPLPSQVVNFILGPKQLPHSTLDTISFQFQSHAEFLAGYSIQQPIPQKEKSLEMHAARGPSVVHRLCASGIVQIFLFFQVFLPYLRHLIQLLYQFERTNHVSERVLATGMSVLDSVGKKGSDVLGIILRSGNGRMIQLVAAVSIWWIKEVSNGIQDGVEGCVELVDESKNQERRLKHGNDAMKSQA